MFFCVVKSFLSLDSKELALHQTECSFRGKCTSWLSHFLNRRGLRQPDGRPLYEYHATNEEYNNLTQLLRTVSPTQSDIDHIDYSACFVLFCSEWYRRDYERNYGWTWDPIYKALGISLTSTELRNMIPKGMEGYWIRPIRFYESDRRNFLGTLFSEGGLPFRLLKESDSHFQTVFSRILHQYEQAQIAEYPIQSLVRAVIDKSALPAVFSEDTSVELISHIAEKLSSLVIMHNLSNHDEPVKQLDLVQPKWRGEFPMPLDDETGTHFLNGLLCTASVETKSRLQKNKRSGCQFYWLESQPDQIKAIISLPDELSFSIVSEPSTTRFELAIYEDGEEVASLGPAYATLENTYAKVRLRRNELRFVRRQPAASLSIVARTGGMIVGAIQLERSEIAIGEVPLTFIQDGERWLLQGQASCSVRHSNVLIALPKNETSISGYESVPGAVSLLGFQTLSIKGRQDVIISGNETYRIRTGREQSNPCEFGFLGKRVDWNCHPEETFLGVPKVTTKHPEIENIQLKRYLNGISLDECQVQEMMGTQFFSVRNTQNETLLRRKIGILPADFNIEIKSGELVNEGSIIISTQHPCISVLKDKTLEASRKRSAGKIEILLKAEGIPPAFISIQIYPNLSADPIEMVLPYPAKGCLAIDANGSTLDKNITLHDLLGSRAFLFGNSSDPTHFSLELHLRSKSGLQAWHEWYYTVKVPPIELNLYSLKEHIENLFSLETGIDQVIEMRIKGAGTVMNWQIRRYKYSLHYDYERELLSSQPTNYRTGKTPSPTIMLLSEPGRKVIPLSSRMSEGVSLGEYELGSIVNKNGPWLVVPRQGEEMEFRPCFIRGEPPLPMDENNIHSLQKATQLFNPRSDVNTITLVLEQMASDPAHSGWQFLRNLYDQFGYLPLATFEVWRALVQHPQALAMSLFKFEMSIDYLNRIESEFPVFWEFLPITEVKHAAMRFRAFLTHKGAPEEMQIKLLGRMFQQLGTVFPTYASEVQIWLDQGKLPPAFPAQMIKGIIHEWHQELLREHSESRWPEFGGSDLFRWYASQKDPIIEASSDTSYRYSVTLLPIFAAAVACGKTTFDSVFENKPGAVFFLRQVRDFDSRWFNAIFQYCLLRHMAEK